MADFRRLLEEYRSKRYYIKKRLKEFGSLRKAKDEEIFSELCFCLLTPQSNARLCDKAIQELKNKGLILKGSANAIRTVLKGRARFHNKKAQYIVNARGAFGRKDLARDDPFDLRAKIVKDIKGIGYKEASHFLRNIGLGEDMAILDRHILKNLKRYGVINKVPDSLSPKAYLNIEASARHFAKRMGLSLGELDLLLWSRETGEIFK